MNELPSTRTASLPGFTRASMAIPAMIFAALLSVQMGIACKVLVQPSVPIIYNG